MPEANTCTIALVQMASGADAEKNLVTAVARVEEAAQRGADVVCLPELFRSPYPCQTEDTANFRYAEPVPGPTTEALARTARDTRCVLVASVFEKRAPGLYHNTAVVLDRDGRLAGKYRKMHIPDDPSYYEKFYFTPGDLGFQAFETGVGRVGALVCWDQWYPEAARLVALKGARLICYPTAIGGLVHESAEYVGAQMDAWRTVQRSHAVTNGVFVAAVNRVGYEPRPGNQDAGIRFWGCSFVCDPFGVVVAEAHGDGDETLLAEIDFARVDSVRQEWPFLRDRRTDAYRGIDERYHDHG